MLRNNNNLSRTSGIRRESSLKKIGMTTADHVTQLETNLRVLKCQISAKKKTIKCQISAKKDYKMPDLCKKKDYKMPDFPIYSSRFQN